MKKMSIENKMKLKKFMEQQENMFGIVTLLTLLSYLIVLNIFKNSIVILFAYMVFYICYMKLYKYVYYKLFRDFGK